ncbi:MAG: SAM-dependent methyltransferase [Ottowia sp.]|nr:SAM-dependent methyltransferase [Ottowia sp.]
MNFNKDRSVAPPTRTDTCTPLSSTTQPVSTMLNVLQQQIMQKEGWLPFDEYMNIVLYTPGLGYYANTQRKFGRQAADGSDFVTAPELSPLFAENIAFQLADTLIAEALFRLLEFGAGSGQLAAHILLTLDTLGVPLEQYAIIELSGTLRIAQETTIRQVLCDRPDLFNKVVWLDTLPHHFAGIMLGNEVLDAMPITLYARQQGHWFERGVSWDNKTQALIWKDRPLRTSLPHVLTHISGDHNYVTEVHEQAHAFIRSLVHALEKGLILLIDYGFPAAEYYHPQRHQGTLMAHFRHQSSTDPFFNPGQSDLTAHVNFSGIAQAAIEAGATLFGYTNQARFLLNGGLLKQLIQIDPSDPAHYLPASKAVQHLVSEAEMGELFKVIAFGKKISTTLSGFTPSDRSHTL